MMPALEIHNLGIRLGGLQILSGVNACIEPGEFVGIFGPNGAGKSTLVRAILGLCPVGEGSIRILGGSPREKRRQVGYMPQSRIPFERAAMSAREMVRAVQGGTRWGLPIFSSQDASEVERVLGLSGSAGYASRPFGVLSGGERQRVFLAQSLLGSPPLLILDEPLASLDPKNQCALVAHVERIRIATGAAVLFIAHDVNPLLPVMQRVLYIAGGSARSGSPEEVISSDSLSALYQTPIEVIRDRGRVFILHAESNALETARHG